MSIVLEMLTTLSVSATGKTWAVRSPRRTAKWHERKYLHKEGSAR